MHYACSLYKRCGIKGRKIISGKRKLEIKLLVNFRKNYVIRNAILCIGLIIVFSFCINIFDLFDKTLFFIFQNRDISRARNLLAGNLIFYGPEMTGGGNLPGPLYYIFLSVSQFFSQTWKSAWIMQLILVQLATLIAAFYFKTKGSITQMLLWVVFFSLAPFTYNYLKFFLNISSMFVFTVSALILILKVQDDKNSLKTRSNSFLWASLIIGMGLQFHFSIITFYIALLLMNYFPKKIGLCSVSQKTILKGIALFLAPSLPYFIWSLCARLNLNFGVPAFYSGTSASAPVSLLHLMTYGYSEGQGYIIAKTLFSLTPFTLFLILPIYYFDKNKDSKVSDEKVEFLKKIKPLLVCVVVSFPPVFELFYSPQASRYTMPFCVGLNVLNLFFFQETIKSHKRIKIFNVLSVVTLILLWVYVYLFFNHLFTKSIVTFFSVVSIITFLVFLFDKKFFESGKSVLVSLALAVALIQTQHSMGIIGAFASKDWGVFMPNFEEWEKIWTVINRETGWDYEYARRRIYYIGHHLEQDPELALTDFKKNEKKSPKISNPPDGFFVSNRYRTFLTKIWGPQFTAERWMMKQNFQPEVFRAIKNGEIKLGKNVSQEILIIPFWVQDKNKFANFFHDLGEGYKLSEDDKKLSLVPGKEGVMKNGVNEFIFKWNENPDQNEYSSTGAIVSMLKKDSSNFLVNVKVVGFTLSQITPWVMPTWTQAWLTPYVRVRCDNEDSKIFLLATSIGFNRSYSYDVKTPLLQGNNSFVGPFERSFEINCKNGIKGLSIGRSGSSVETITKVNRLPEKVLSININ